MCRLRCRIFLSVNRDQSRIESRPSAIIEEPPETPRDITEHYLVEGLKRVLNWSPIMPRDASLFRARLMSFVTNFYTIFSTLDRHEIEHLECRMHIYIYHVYIYSYVYTFIYTFMYTFIYTFMYTHIYMHIQPLNRAKKLVNVFEDIRPFDIQKPCSKLKVNKPCHWLTEGK